MSRRWNQTIAYIFSILCQLSIRNDSMKQHHTIIYTGVGYIYIFIYLCVCTHISENSSIFTNIDDKVPKEWTCTHVSLVRPYIMSYTCKPVEILLNIKWRQIYKIIYNVTGGLKSCDIVNIWYQWYTLLKYKHLKPTLRDGNTGCTRTTECAHPTVCRMTS